MGGGEGGLDVFCRLYHSPAFLPGFEQITNPVLDKCGGPNVRNGDFSHRQLFSYRIMKSYPRSYDPDSILAADNGSICASLNS